MTNEKPKLPAGQIELQEFPRFGLTKFAQRFPTETKKIQFDILGNVGEKISISNQLKELPRVEQISDFHCVTTWSKREVKWGGVRFSDFYEQIIVPKSRPDANATFVVFRGQDGYCVSMPLADLLADTVLLADSLDGTPLPIAHGAPIRLVAPAHYGYKNVKHLRSIEFCANDSKYRFSAFKFMDHPRGRVALEERGRAPGILLRHLYRPLVEPTIARFRKALDLHLAKLSKEK